MFNHHYEMIMTQKRNEVEQYAKEAWKFDVLKNKGTLRGILLMIKSFHKDQRTCAVC
jgi:hypothetical protein